MASVKPSPLGKKAKSDQSVMGTNNSSIVSKRSVERLYHDEPHFFRHFVKKPQRRAPLIHRGYWLRMHAIDVVVRQFLEEPSSKKKLILNLGCGYDPLAFQWLSKINGGPLAQHAIFIDVDFPELISKKSQMISSTPQICELLGEIQLSEDSSGMFLRSPSYYAIGCDLADTNGLDKLLSSLLDLSEYEVLCTAEVSITYMDVNAADSLIEWAARHKDARFCLLEQFLPDGVNHPFASKMLQHFINLQTPLKNIGKYPGLNDQVRRFSMAGWPSVDARSLWDIFRDPVFVSYDDRIALDQVEQFDEWEELILFASHYFLLVAKQYPDTTAKPLSSVERPTSKPKLDTSDEWLVQSQTLVNPCPARKFGAIVRKTFNDRDLHHLGGFGLQSRTATTNFYRIDSQPENGLIECSKSMESPDRDMILLPVGCEPRMCCTITAIGYLKLDWLLVGGRKSPYEPLKDCWLLRDQRWRRVDDLPVPLYRHCSESILVRQGLSAAESAVLVYGGKTLNNTVSDQWVLWRESTGWETVTANVRLSPVFGAAMVSQGKSRGVLLGGLSSAGMIRSAVFVWNVEYSKDTGWCIHLTECSFSLDGADFLDLQYLSRFGATIERTSQGFVLIGGVANKVIPSCYEVVEIFCNYELETGSSIFHVKLLANDLPSPRPLLVGHSSLYNPGRIIIIGGGAVCFSFGSHWNTAPIIFCSQRYLSKNQNVAFVGSSDERETPVSQLNQLRVEPKAFIRKEITEVSSLLSARVFGNVMAHEQPVVCRDLNLGRCVAEWQSLDKVKDGVHRDQEVVVHVSGHRHMDFRQKNFDYVKKSFGSFIDDFHLGHKQYLRSLAAKGPAEKPADFRMDFPRLAEDFDFLDQLSLLTKEIHSSVLRISGFVDMWLHYDVMANFLCQIRSTKRLILFPPSDVSHFSLPAGNSTSSVDCFSADFPQDPALAQTHPHHVTLQPGDVLYIPPLWLHAASPTDTPSSDTTPADGVSISINMFFRSLESGYAPGRDVYGNRDVQAYEKGRQDIEKMTRAFDRLPPDMRRFYLDRLADELKEKASSSHQQG